MTPLLAQKPRVDRAFERLYRRFATDVYRYAYVVLRNESDAEDVTQTTFMNAYRALERGEQPRAPLNWLISIAHNVCRQRFRAAARRPQEVELDFDVADGLVVENDDDGPTSEDIGRALGHLAFNQRAALVMRELEGRSYAEIGEVLDLSVGAVETLIFRARRALREQLEGSLTCDQAELAISKQLDGRLSRADKSQLRAHLRECPDCATFARRQRAQRTALKAFGAVPLPSSLAGLFGGGGATIGAGLAVKAAAVVVAAGAVGGVGYDIHHGFTTPFAHPKPAALPSHVRIATPRPVAAVAPVVLERPEPGPPIVKHPSGPRARPHVPAAVVTEPFAPAKPAKPATPAQSRPDRQLRQAERKALLAAKKAAKLAAKKRASFLRGRHLIP